MSFFIEYLKHPMKIGAVAPSSRWLAKQMADQIHFEDCNCIVEYGSGTGVFTDEILQRNKKVTYLVIEQNEEFYLRLKKKYGERKNLILIHGDAGKIEQYLKEQGIKKVDYIVSGLPFASLPSEVSKTILEATQRVLGDHGRFITFQYTLFKKKFFEEYFEIANTNYKVKNLPPAFVLTMKNS